MSNERMVVTLGVKAAAKTRALAERQGVSSPEVLRRGLSLLSLFVEKAPSQDLVLLDRDTGEAIRLLPLWD